MAGLHFYNPEHLGQNTNHETGQTNFNQENHYLNGLKSIGLIFLGVAFPPFGVYLIYRLATRVDEVANTVLNNQKSTIIRAELIPTLLNLDSFHYIDEVETEFTDKIHEKIDENNLTSDKTSSEQSVTDIARAIDSLIPEIKEFLIAKTKVYEAETAQKNNVRRAKNGSSSSGTQSRSGSVTSDLTRSTSSDSLSTVSSPSTTNSTLSAFSSTESVDQLQYLNEEELTSRKAGLTEYLEVNFFNHTLASKITSDIFAERPPKSAKNLLNIIYDPTLDFKPSEYFKTIAKFLEGYEASAKALKTAYLQKEARLELGENQTQIDAFMALTAIRTFIENSSFFPPVTPDPMDPSEIWVTSRSVVNDYIGSNAKRIDAITLRPVITEAIRHVQTS